MMTPVASTKARQFCLLVLLIGIAGVCGGYAFRIFARRRRRGDGVRRLMLKQRLDRSALAWRFFWHPVGTSGSNARVYFVFTLQTTAAGLQHDNIRHLF